MKIAGIVLICLQALAVFGAIVGGGLPTGIAELLGFFAAGIIGIILLIVAKKKEKKKSQ